MHFEAKFAPTSEDVITGYRMHSRQSNDVWKAYAIGAALLIVVFAVIAYLMRFFMIGLLGVGGAVGGLGGFLLGEIGVRKQAKQVTGEEVAYALSDEGVEFTSSTTHSRLPWSYFTKVRIDHRGVVLYTKDATYSYLPARAFSSERFPMEELGAFLATKIKKCLTRR